MEYRPLYPLILLHSITANVSTDTTLDFTGFIAIFLFIAKILGEGRGGLT